MSKGVFRIIFVRTSIKSALAATHMGSKCALLYCAKDETAMMRYQAEYRRLYLTGFSA